VLARHQASRERKAVHGLDPVSLRIVYFNAAVASLAAVRLEDQEQIVDGIELDVRSGLGFARCALDGFLRAGLGCEIVEFQIVVLRRGARNVVGGIHGDSVDGSFAEAGEFADA
jgi:hypothetical protein